MNNDRVQPRRQISENETRPRSSSTRKMKDGPSFSKLLRCVCCKDADSEQESQQKRVSDLIAEMRLAQRGREREEPSYATSPSRDTRETHISQGQNNKICYHRSTSASTPAHNFPAEVRSSQNSCKKTSDLEFEDARDYFSPTETENEPEIIPSEKASRTEVTVKTPSRSPKKHMKGNLKRCRYATYAGSMREIGNQEPYQDSDVCDQRQWDRQTMVKLHPQLKVVEYDIRSGAVHEERVEEVNFTGEHEPLGEMKNPDVMQNANTCRLLAERRLRNLFHANRYVEVDFEEDDEPYESHEDRDVEEGYGEEDDFIEDDQDWSLETLPPINESPQ